MTQEKIKELRELEATVQDAPWRLDITYMCDRKLGTLCDRDKDCEDCNDSVLGPVSLRADHLNWYFDLDQYSEVALLKLIVAMRNALPELLAAAEELECMRARALSAEALANGIYKGAQIYRDFGRQEGNT